MEEFRKGIKDAILRKANATVWDFEDDKSRVVNKYGYDELDQIVFQAAEILKNRHLTVFSLLYKCHDRERARLALKGSSEEMLDMKTINRYKSAAFKDVIETVTNDQNIMARVLKLVS